MNDHAVITSVNIKAQVKMSIIFKDPIELFQDSIKKNNFNLIKCANFISYDGIRWIAYSNLIDYTIYAQRFSSDFFLLFQDAVLVLVSVYTAIFMLRAWKITSEVS